MTTQFFVIQVMTGDEQQFISLMQRSLIDLKGVDTEVRLWWPRRKLKIRRKGKTRSSLAPMFPGYVFLECESIPSNVFRAIKRTTGFVRFLKSNTDIRPLASEDLELIRHFLSFGEVVEESKVVFDENNRIVVKEGPLSGLEGRIVKVDRRKGRAKVKLDMYENAFLIDLGFELLERGKEPVKEESV